MKIEFILILTYSNPSVSHTADSSLYTREAWVRATPTSMAGAARADTAHWWFSDSLDKQKRGISPVFGFSLYGAVTIYLI